MAARKTSRAAPRRAAGTPNPRSRGSTPRRPASAKPGPPSLDDQLRGVLRLLAHLGVRATAYRADEDGDPGVSVVRPRPHDVRPHSAPLDMMLDPDRAIEWAICVAAFERGVLA